jgi:hypothetical protein
MEMQSLLIAAKGYCNPRSWKGEMLCFIIDRGSEVHFSWQ